MERIASRYTSNLGILMLQFYCPIQEDADNEPKCKKSIVLMLDKQN